MRERFTVNGEAIELTQEEALDFIAEVRARFDVIGTDLVRDEVEDYIGRLVPDEEWYQVEDVISDDVLRLIQSLP